MSSFVFVEIYSVIGGVRGWRWGGVFCLGFNSRVRFSVVFFLGGKWFFFILGFSFIIDLSEL